MTLTPLDPADLAAAEALYLASFPPEERRDWQQIADPALMPRLLGVYDDAAALAGFITIWPFDTFIYVEHSAVDPSRRGAGIGATAIELLRRQSELPIVLEVEPPTHPDPMAPRRIRFYERCGLHLLDYDYTQPPYAPGLPSVPLRLMTTDPTLSPRTIETTLHTRVYQKA